MNRRGRIVALALGAWLACTLLGLFLVDLDYGPSLVSLPRRHGVTLVDATGAALLLAGWSTAVMLARRRAWPMFRTLGRFPSTAALLASCAGLLTVALLVPDFAGRKFVVAGFVLLVEAAAAASALAPRGGGFGSRRKPDEWTGRRP
jgi:hypothetical protein